MGNPAHSRVFNFSGSGYTVVKSNEDSASGFPAVNASDWWHPYRPWKTSGAFVNGSSYLGYVWTNNTALVGLYIDDCSIAGVKVESYDGATWTTRYTVTIPQCLLTGKLKGYLTLGSWNYKGVRILANTTADGTQMRVGSLIPVTSVTTWGTDISDFGEVVGRAGIANDDFLSGNAEPIAVGNYYGEIIIGKKLAATSSLRANLLELQRYRPNYFLFVQDLSLATTNPTEKAWILRQIAFPSLAYPDNNAGVQWVGVVLREAC